MVKEISCIELFHVVRTKIKGETIQPFFCTQNFISKIIDVYKWNAFHLNIQSFSIIFFPVRAHFWLAHLILFKYRSWPVFWIFDYPNGCFVAFSQNVKHEMGAFFGAENIARNEQFKSNSSNTTLHIHVLIWLYLCMVGPRITFNWLNCKLGL